VRCKPPTLRRNVHPPAHVDILPLSISSAARVPHSPAEKKKALARVRRIRGQLDALERALEAGADCAPVLQQLAAVRGAVNGLMSEVLESHLRETLAQSPSNAHLHDTGIDAAVALVRSYLR
jgi:FrmR/RcnR family transcriptional regulator, repressor of frmRAB operon